MRGIFCCGIFCHTGSTIQTITNSQNDDPLFMWHQTVKLNVAGSVFTCQDEQATRN